MIRVKSFYMIVLPFLCLSDRTFASESVNYSYDVRGRLVAASRSGTVNSGVSSTYTLDKEGNRSQLVVSSGGESGGGLPVANNDSYTYSTYEVCQGLAPMYPLANDSDAGGHTPLAIVAVGAPFFYDGAYVGYSVGYVYPGTITVTYVMENSLHAQASAQITLTITGDARSCD